VTHVNIAAEQHGDLIVRERNPVNLEFPFDHLDGFLTPNDLFYVRSHFDAPRLDSACYRLRVTGSVSDPLSIGYDDLLAMPAVTQAATLECAGNGRTFLEPRVKGVQWLLGAVSTAEWTGVRLSALLKRAGVQLGAAEIVLEGADYGKPKTEPFPPGETKYSRSIAVEKATDVLLAYKMNGEDLSIDHGYPVRAVVLGHYGMASVKWLTQIHVVNKPFAGYWQTSDYGYWEYQDGNPVRCPLGAMALKSAIARPRPHEAICGGKTYPVFGAAWSGEAAVTQVEVSADDGATWAEVKFLDEARPFVWRRWAFDWNVPRAKGSYTLKSRATDVNGNTQQEEHDQRFGPYVIHHTIGIEVTVR
jgi:DMSO/TMAO reductase YedYZ molybdopterin-dependent catalytic subunit